jgi:hypothetical protein
VIQFRFCFLLCCFIAGKSFAVDKIVLWDKSIQYAPFKELITLIADASIAEYGPYSLEPSIKMEQGRAFVNLKNDNEINLVIAGVNKEREKSTLPIYFPLTRGLLGFRICLVNKQATARFNDINTIKDFRTQRLTIGVGFHWPDKNILQENGLQTVSTPVQSQLFDMLASNRFDCLLKGIAEIDFEMQTYASKNISVEGNLGFIYPYAHFMFVSKSQQRLHKRLEHGLAVIRKNGLYKKYFDKNFRNFMQKHRFYNRKLLILKNTDLSAPARKAINTYGIASFSS